MPRAKVPITVPSFGAAENRYSAALMLPAPGMFCGISVGFPGMCLPMMLRQHARIEIVTSACANSR